MNVFIQEIKEYDLEKIYNFLKESTTDFWYKIKDKKNILIKPNLLAAFLPEKAVTTHPVILEALIILLKEHKKNIFLGDGPGGTTPVLKVWQTTGMIELCEKYDVKLVNFSEGGVLEKNIEFHKFGISKRFMQADAVINVSKMKTHSLMYYTGAVKNLYGVIPGLKKSDFHKNYPDPDSFGKVLSELYKIVQEKVVLNIMDGIWGMEGDGPSAGDPRNFGLVFTCEKASALDFIAAQMMGFKISKLKYIISALEFDKINPTKIKVSEKWENFIFHKVKIKKIGLMIKIFTYSPQFLKNIFRRFYWYYPDFNEKCTLCEVCVKSCPVQAMEIIGNDKTPTIDLSKCINCMCCHELCPSNAVYIKKSFLAKYLIK
ncbi:MAG: DUF362 domain-containing protein [Armatimonadetes bacterium]|nr:DUF362 domain-containing protein [Armatimonadota bacterium]